MLALCTIKIYHFKARAIDHSVLFFIIEKGLLLSSLMEVSIWIFQSWDDSGCLILMIPGIYPAAVCANLSIDLFPYSSSSPAVCKNQMC